MHIASKHSKKILQLVAYIKQLRKTNEFLYTVWVKKNPPCGFLTFFPKRMGIFNQFFYTPILRSFLH